MVVITCLLVLFNLVASGVAVAALQATAGITVAGLDLRRHDKGKDIPEETSLDGTIHTRAEAGVGAAGASWEYAHGRALAAKRKRRSVFQPQRPSAYVSLSKVQPFTGDVNPSSALLSALETRSFRREVILITDTRPRAAVQVYDNLAQLGLVHVLWLTNGQATCTAADGLLKARADLRQRRYAHEQQQPATSIGAAEGGVVLGTLRRRFMQAAAARQTGTGSSTGREQHFSAGEESRHVRGLHSSQEPVLPTNVSAIMAALATANEAAARERRSSISGVVGAGVYATGSADLGCVWSSQSFPDIFSGHRRLMMKRLMLLARVVRQGYNLLSLDTDVIVFREPYSFLKHLPYSHAHMLVGKSIRGGSMVNTGVMYFQNVSRTGPVSWLLSSTVDRNLRWLEMTPSPEGTPQLLAPHEADRRGCWDQFLFADAVLTSITGKLSLFYCARPPEWLLARSGARRAEEDSSSWNIRHREALNLGERQGPADLMVRETTHVTDQALLTLVGSDSFTTSWANLTIFQDPPPLLKDEPGYKLPPIKPDGLAVKFQQLLVADDSESNRRLSQRLSHASRVTITTDGEPEESARRLQQSTYVGGNDASSSSSNNNNSNSSSTGKQSDDQESRPPLHRNVEMLAYASDWLVGGWTQRGILGLWDPALTHGVPRQVFAHLVRSPGPTNIGKEAVRMQYGEYDWELAALTDGGPFPFLGSENATTLPRVVALLPNVDTTTMVQTQWTNLARGLAQLALLTGRRIAWPAVPCASKWVQPNPGSRRALPLNQNLRFLVSGTFSSGLLCTPSTVLHQKCLYERLAGGRNDNDTDVNRDEAPPEVPRREGPRGLLPIEFEMLLRVLPPSVAQPGPHNTVHLQGNDDYEDGEGGERPVMFDEPPRTEGITYVKAADVVKPLREVPLAAQPVIYLAQRTFLTQLDKLGDQDFLVKYRTFRNECPALR